MDEELSRRKVLHGLALGAGAVMLGACSTANVASTTPGTSTGGGANGPGGQAAAGTTSTTAIATATPSGAPVLLGVPTTETPHQPGTRPDPNKAEGTDLLPEIEHIVVLMMENHSFDNYFGMLGRGDGFTLDKDGKPTNANVAKDGSTVVAYHLPTTVQKDNHVTQNWVSSHTQYGDGKNDGFAATSGKEGMGYWTEEDLPFYYSLAREFPLCDRWFGSVLSQTYPNRRFLAAATAFGNITTELPKVDDPSPPGGTIFDKLDAFGVTWRNYSSGLPEIALYPAVFLKHQDKVSKIEQFVSDAAAGTLPSYSLVTPHPNVSEENPQDIHQGESFAAGIINAVMKSPAWSKTVLIFTYDEHGGYYDHVPPPPAFKPDDVPPDPAKTKGVPGGYDRLGFRVPAVIVSPFAKKDYVSHVVHDHTSILRLIETKWNLGALTFRDANASNLLDTLDFANPPAFATPPKLADSFTPANPIQVPPKQAEDS
jgi:phospholipase C